MRISPISFYNANRLNTVRFSSRKTSSYSDIKQQNEYYCAPAAAANTIINLMPGKNFNAEKLVNDLAHLMKTDKNGTTSDNLCKALDLYLNNQMQPVKIEYEGFRNVDKKYKTGELPNSDKIKAALNNGEQVILNLGVYKKLGGTYIRQYGHFVNAVSANGNSLSVTDPYDKTGSLNNINLKKLDRGKLIHNKDDNEEALTDNASGFYEVSPKFSYFNYGETAIINGVIIIKK